MNQEEKRQLENFLVSEGFNGISDLDQLAVYAKIIEDFPGDKHWFFRGMINECDADKRRDMYYSLQPRFTTFKPLPLETYLAQIAEQAGALVSHRVLRVEGAQPDAIRVGDDHFVSAEGREGTHTLIRFTCAKCTRQAAIAGETYVDAIIKARKKGWVHDNGDEICPKCPAVRTKVGHA